MHVDSLVFSATNPALSRPTGQPQRLDGARHADLQFNPLQPSGVEGATKSSAAGATETSKTSEVLRQFEKMVLSQFLEMMTKTVQAESLGDGLSAEIYNSYFAQAAADQIVESGGLGIAKLVSETQPSLGEK